MKKYKPLIVFLLIPLAAGGIGTLLGNSKMGFDLLNKPGFNPPAIVFPIVWTILYILMGISSYIIYKSNHKNRKSALIIYGVQLLFNMLWNFFFFNMKWFLFSYIWLLVLIVLVGIMIYYFYTIDKKAAYLQIPYFLWLLFASILNFSIYLLN